MAPRLTRPAGSETDVNDVQPLKSERVPNNLVMLGGSVTDFSEEQPRKMLSPSKRVRPAGSSIEVKAEQFSKAPAHMQVRSAGSVTDLNAEQPMKAPLPMLLRPAGSANDVIDVSLRNAIVGQVRLSVAQHACGEEHLHGRLALAEDACTHPCH